MTLERRGGDHSPKKDIEVRRDTLPVSQNIADVFSEMANQGNRRQTELVPLKTKEDTGVRAPGFLRRTETLLRELPHDAATLGIAAARGIVTAYDARGTTPSQEKKRPVKKAQMGEKTRATVFSKYDEKVGLGRLTKNPSHPRGKVEAGLGADGIGGLLLTSDNFKVQAAGALIEIVGLATIASGVKEGITSDDKSRPANTPEEIKDKRLDSFQARIDTLNRKIDRAEDKGKDDRVRRLNVKKRSLSRRYKKLKQH